MSAFDIPLAVFVDVLWLVVGFCALRYVSRRYSDEPMRIAACEAVLVIAFALGVLCPR